jgi:CBS domain containing-hemolysin-like protein
MFVVRLIGVLALVALNGFFGAAEISLVAVRVSRIRQLVAAGNARARVVEGLLSDLHRVVSGVQLGITLTSLALGALGEATFANLFLQIWHGQPGMRSALVAHGLALVSAFIVLSAMHVVIGELVPKTVSLARAERVALLIALPFHWFLNTFRWVIAWLDGVSGAVVKLLGVTQPHGHNVAHSTEELQIQIQQARERGLLAVGEEKFITSAMELGQIQVREIMVPRPDMHTLPVEASLDEVMRVFATTQRSRIPVYRGTADHILGFVHIKDMLWVLQDRERRLKRTLRHSRSICARTARCRRSETKPAGELLLELRTRHAGMLWSWTSSAAFSAC